MSQTNQTFSTYGDTEEPSVSEQLQPIRENIGSLFARIRNLEEAISDLAASGVATTTSQSEPVIRVRLQHSHTKADGWRLSETTVEYTGEKVDWDQVTNDMYRAFLEGEIEASTRNEAAS